MTKHPPAETLGSVPISSGVSSSGKPYGGNISDGELRREVDPTGAIVEHRVRKSPYVHERLHSSGKLAHELFDAAEKFRVDFERAQLCGNYARLDMFKTRAGPGTMSDGVMRAKMRINKSLEALGKGKDGPNMLQSCAWSVVGLGMTLEGWTGMVRAAGTGMNADKSAGILHGALELLALHYGLINMGRIASLSNEKAFGRGIRATIDFITVFASTAQGGEKAVIGRLLNDLGKRFEKFA